MHLAVRTTALATVLRSDKPLARGHTAAAISKETRDARLVRGVNGNVLQSLPVKETWNGVVNMERTTSSAVGAQLQNWAASHSIQPFHPNGHRNVFCVQREHI